MLVLGAVLLGFEEKQKQSLEPHLRSKLESALVKATNLALQIDDSEDTIGKHAVAFVLNHTFQLLTNSHLNYDLLLPILMEAVFSSKEGLEQGYWLSMIDRDVVEIAGRKFNWSTRSNTYHMIQKIQDRPLIASLGPMSRLIAHSVGSMDDSSLSLVVLDRLANAARTLSIAWRQNKLSEIDVSEEREFLDAEALQTTLPTLWHLLRLSLFATVIILRAVMGRVLDDPELSSDPRAPFLAIQCLHILRDFYFVSSRLGQTSSSQYVFVSMVAIDILTQYPDQAENFIHSIRPVNQGRIPAHPVDRCMDLFFFNIAEHFTLNVSPKFNEEVVLAAAMPYLIAGGNKFLVETFEAAHSLTLSVLAGPQNAEVSARHLPFYLDALFKCFPESLSERQFRLAFKTMVRISSPPSPPAESQPLLPSILLDTIYERAKHAPTTSLQQAKVSPQNVSHGLSLSEQAVLVMALIDSLCFLHPILLEEWLPLTASLVMQIGGAEMRRVCQDRFWEAMSSGEMDVVRAAICVAWWSSRGGREQLLNDNDELRQEHFMSGALPIESRL